MSRKSPVHQIVDSAIEHNPTVNSLRTDVAALKTDVTVLKSDVTVLKSDVAVLKGDVAVLKGDVAQLKVDVVSIREEQHRFGLVQEAMAGDIRTILEAVTTVMHNSETFAGHGRTLSAHEVRLDVLETSVGQHLRDDDRHRGRRRG